jgi:uncharacterized metal-binding protein
LAFANKIAVNAAIQDFKTSFERIIAVEGCLTACATQLLTSMGFTPASTLVLSDKHRSDERIGLTAEEDVEIEARVPEVVQRLVDLAPSSQSAPSDSPKEG